MSKEFGDLSHAIEAQREAGVMTDQWLLPKFFQLTKGTEVHLVATDSFIGKSKDQYNAAWLSRELIQNFVDHNPDDQGTLNGVEITTENLPKSNDMPKGGKRITIKGNWKFENPTGVISPHSEKPTDTETAGGNGIGLKQSALRMLRDFGAKKFEIEGEGWKVDYGMIKKDDVNQAIQENLPEMQSTKVHHDWLVADLSKTKNSGTNSYVIETDNEELIAALADLPNLGVSSANKYLQNLDLEAQTKKKQSIALKWLQPKEDGRLFVNGQVMNYEKNGTESNDYWRGPEGLSISLKGVKYKMSIDRPPVSKYDFDNYLDSFTKELSLPQLTDQLQKSYHLWKGFIAPIYEKPGFMVMVNKIIDELKKRKDFKPETFKELFPEKLLANDSKLEEKDIKKLQSEGYIVCDEAFAKIGMDKVSSIFKLDQALVREKRPDDPSRKIEQMAEETGLQVYFEEFGRISTQDFIKKIGEFAKKYKAEMVINDDGVKIIIPEGTNTATLYAQIPYPKKNIGQQLVFELRSLIKHGLEKKLFDENTHTTNADIVTTYKSDTSFACGDREQTLIVRNTRIRQKQYTSENLPLEISLLFGKNLTAQQINEIANILSQLSKGEVAKIIPSTQPTEITSGRKAADRGLNFNQPTITRKSFTTDLHPSTPPTKPNWFKRTLLVLGGIGVFGAVAHEIPQAPDVAAIRTTNTGDNSNNTAKEKIADQFDVTETTKTNVAQQKKLKEANDKFQKFINQNPDALIGGSDLGRTDINHVKKGTAKVEAKTHTQETSPEIDSNEAADLIEDFEPLAEISPKQTEQIKMLTSYLELTTDANLSGIKFFIFKGKGALGVNHGGKFIGIHEAMFETDFFEALSTVIHEVAHSNPNAQGHGNEFRHTMQNLFSAALEKEHRENDPHSKEATFKTRWEELKMQK